MKKQKLLPKSLRSLTAEEAAAYTRALRAELSSLRSGTVFIPNHVDACREAVAVQFCGKPTAAAVGLSHRRLKKARKKLRGNRTEWEQFAIFCSVPDDERRYY